MRLVHKCEFSPPLPMSTVRRMTQLRHRNALRSRRQLADLDSIFRRYGVDFEPVSTSWARSEAVFSALADSLVSFPSTPEIVILGSVARHEAVPLSDLDYVVLCPPGNADQVSGRIADILAGICDKFGLNGTRRSSLMGAAVDFGKLVDSIGKPEDGTHALTWRVLSFAEGARIRDGDTSLTDFKRLVFERYVRSAMQGSLMLIGEAELSKYWMTLVLETNSKLSDDPLVNADRWFKTAITRRITLVSCMLCLWSSQRAPQRELRSLMSTPPIYRISKLLRLNLFENTEDILEEICTVFSKYLVVWGDRPFDVTYHDDRLRLAQRCSDVLAEAVRRFGMPQLLR